MLNNCIGEKNYNYFVQAINWVSWYHFINLVNAGLTVYDLKYTDDHLTKIKSKFRQAYGASGEKLLSSKVLLIVLHAKIIINFILMVYFLYLIRFHAKLNQLGISTYHYLKLKEGRENEKSRVVIRVSELDTSKEMMQFSKEQISKEKSKNVHF